MLIKLKDDNGRVIQEVEVDDAFGEWYIEQERIEENAKRRDRYWVTVSLDSLEYEGEWFADNDTPDYFYNLLEEEERVEAFISSLEEHEQRRLRLKMDEPSLSYTKIAAIEGVNESSIRRTFERIAIKFKNFFPELMPN